MAYSALPQLPVPETTGILTAMAMAPGVLPTLALVNFALFALAVESVMYTVTARGVRRQPVYCCQLELLTAVGEVDKFGASYHFVLVWKQVVLPKHQKCPPAVWCSG